MLVDGRSIAFSASATAVDLARGVAERDVPAARLKLTVMAGN